MHVCTYVCIQICMIKARIRWCSCRVENILTLGKLLSLWFCFLLHSILFFISQTSSRTYKIISSYVLARPIMGTIFLVNIYIYVGMSVVVQKSVGGITWAKRACSKSVLGGKILPVTPILLISTICVCYLEESNSVFLQSARKLS